MMSIILTQSGYNKLNAELNHLLKVERPSACQFIEDTRPIGVVEDNPEYMQALDNQCRIDKRIHDLTSILADSMIFTSNMAKPNTVSFGATVEIINEDTDETKIYTIVSVYESDISRGLISIESPFVRSMLGNMVGDEFEFNDNYFIINNISYSL